MKRTAKSGFGLVVLELMVQSSKLPSVMGQMQGFQARCLLSQLHLCTSEVLPGAESKVQI